MKNNPENKKSAIDADSLRKKAEGLLKEKQLKTGFELSKAETLKLIHELELHNIELELQNKELVLAKVQAEEAQQKSEEQFHNLYMNMIDGATLCELIYNNKGVPVDYVIVETNRAFDIQLGISGSSAVGKTGREAYGVSEPPLLENYSRVATTGEPIVFEAYFQPFAKHYSILIYCLHKGRIATIFKDNTESHLAEKKILQNNKRLESLVKILQFNTKNLQDFLHFALDELIRITGSKTGNMYFYNEEIQEFELNTWSKETTTDCTDVNPQKIFRLDKTGIWGEVVRQRKPIIDNNFEAEHPQKKGHVHLKKILTIPVFFNNKIVAVACVANKTEDYDHTDILQMTLLMSDVWITTERIKLELALQASEERFRTLYENAKIGFYRTSPDGTIIMANKALVAMLGYSSFNELAKRYLELDGFESLEQRKTFIEKIEQSGELENIESIWIRQDRTRIFVRESARAIRDSNSKTSYYDGIVEDITQLRQTQDELNWNIALLEAKANSSTPNSSNDGILVVDPQGKKIFQNQQAADLLKVPRYIADEKDEERELQWVSGLTKNPTQFAERVMYLFSHPEEISRDVIEYKDGTILDRFTAPVVGKDGKYYGRLWIFRDITEHRRMKEALRESEAQYRLLFEVSADGILIVDVETKAFKYANPALCRMLGYTVGELTAMSLADIHPGQELQQIISEFESLARGDKTLAPDIPCVRKDGSILYADINSTPIIIDGRLCNLGLFRDITGRKQAQEVLKYALEHSYQQQAVLNAVTVSHQLADGNVPGLARQITEHSAKALDIERVSVWLFNDTGDELRCIDLYENSRDRHSTGAVLLQNEYKNKFEALKTSKYVDANDPLTDPRTTGYVDRYLKPLGITSMLDAIIREGNRDIGVLCFEHVEKKHNWEPDEIAFASQLADQIAIAVLNHERILAEAALRESKKLIQNIIDNSPSLIYILDLDGKFSLVNRKLTEILNSPAEILLGNTRQLFMPKKFEEQHRNNDLLIISTEQAAIFEEEILESDGQHIYLTQKFPLFDSEGKIYAVGGISTDITGRKRIEEALRYERTLLRLLIDNIPDLIYTKDTACRKTLANIADVKNMGANFESEVLGKDDFAVHPKEIAEKFYADDQSVIQTGQPLLNKEEYVINEEGQKKWLLTSKFPLRNERGQIIGLVGITHDITTSKHTEEEIKLKNEQLLKLNAEKDKFFSIIAHDLRGPFGGFMGFTELLVNELPDLTMDKIQLYASIMRDSAVNLFRFLENILQWASQQQGLIPFKPKLIQLLPVVNESLAIVIGPAKIKNIEIVFDIPPDLEIFADDNLLQTILRNLVSNAVKFTPREGKISLSARKTDEKSVEIAIKDTGIGMNDKMVNNLFRIDVQVNRKGTEGETSTGLGLLLCKEFIEKHGGKIWVESEEKIGTTIYFTIP